MDTLPDTLTLPELMKASIDKDHVIRIKKGIYDLEEAGIIYKFKMPSNQSYGFRIEKEILKLFGIKPPKHITKMCDALFVIQDNKGKDFVFAVEIKSKQKKQYKKQLFNGVYFCKWLIDLLKGHEYYKAEPQYIGLLIKGVNPSQPPKNPVVRSDVKEPISYKGFKIYEMNDEPLIYFNSLIEHNKKLQPN